MEFKALDQELAEIVDRAVEARLAPDVVLASARPVFTEAGVMIERLYRSGLLTPPQHPGPWTCKCLEVVDQSRYVAGATACGSIKFTLSGGLSAAATLSCLPIAVGEIETLADVSRHDDNCQRHAYRHLFYEFILEGEGRELVDASEMPVLQRVVLKAEDGQERSAVIDHAAIVTGIRDWSWVLPLVRHARRACAALDHLVRTGRKKRRKPKSGQRRRTELTQKQLDAVAAVQLHGSVAAAAKHLRKARATVDQSYKSALKKLGQSAIRPKTTRLPRDRRGQENIGPDDDARR